jgi:hypothetical protein
MKRLLGLAVLALCLGVPAHAQIGGSVGGGSLTGSNFRALPNYPPTKFAVTGISGTTGDFIPSAFVAYDQAIAEGKAAVTAKTESVAKVAADNSSTQKPRAKFAMVQDANGNAILVSR